ncbi:MAG: metal-dependent hydrolase [Acidobacteria bacterium]|nr:metal-dependent hydrolase [Acidobacteriota bacterium]
MIDTNVYLSRYPFRRLPGDEPQELVGKLVRGGVERAWCGSFDALLHRDLGSVNRRLADDCRRYGNGLLVPFGCVNPAMPDWREELRRCHEDYRMPGIRVHPNYHGYQLGDASFAELLKAATLRRMIVQIPVLMEDERTQHPVVRVAPEDVSKLADPVASVPGAQVQLLNHSQRAPADVMRRLMSAGQVYVDIAMVENTHGIDQLLSLVPKERVTFGSYYPFYYWESAALKLQEAALLAPDRDAIVRGNATRLRGAVR